MLNLPFLYIVLEQRKSPNLKSILFFITSILFSRLLQKQSDDYARWFGICNEVASECLCELHGPVKTLIPY